MVARQPSSKAAWDALHKNVNTALQQQKANHYVTLRACKDRVRTLQEAHRKNEMNSLRASGTNEEYDERSQLLTELLEQTEEEKRSKKEVLDKTVDIKESQGKDIRKAAMETLIPAKRKNDDDDDEQQDEDDAINPPPVKKRRADTSADYVKYLRDKLELDKERFDIEHREREAMLEKDKKMFDMMMGLLPKKL
ncbi:DNA ligase 1-like [Lineus longissimus]|uniref:DNA ligase 1-like n=1 Tax=Lineus longissimus TaxID=88925 RepID=UPI00315D2AD6